MSDDENVRTVSILTDPRDIKKVAVVCRCAHRFVTDVPGFLDRTREAVVVLLCPACGQPYGRSRGVLTRLDKETWKPGKIVKEVKNGKNESEAVDEPALDGKCITPGPDTLQ